MKYKSLGCIIHSHKRSWLKTCRRGNIHDVCFGLRFEHWEQTMGKLNQGYDVEFYLLNLSINRKVSNGPVRSKPSIVHKCGYVFLCTDPFDQFVSTFTICEITGSNLNFDIVFMDRFVGVQREVLHYALPKIFHPRAANSIAIDSPIPLDAPVTKAQRSINLSKRTIPSTKQAIDEESSMKGQYRFVILCASICCRSLTCHPGFSLPTF